MCTVPFKLHIALTIRVSTLVQDYCLPCPTQALSHLLQSLFGCCSVIWGYKPTLPLLFLLQRCDGAWQLLYSIQFNMIKANEKSRNCIWTAICCSDSNKTVPTGLGMSYLTLECPPPVSFADSPICQTSDDMRRAIGSPTWIILRSSVVFQSLQVSVVVRCGENDKGGYCDNSVMKSTAS